MKELDIFDSFMILALIICASLLTLLISISYTKNQVALLKIPPCPTCGK